MEKTEGKILIVDDNTMNIELLEATLEPLGYDILTFSNPVKAIEETQNTKIELALLDVVMPEMDGFSFAEEFLKNHKYTPVIFVSAHGSAENKIRGFNLGSFAYIEKPIDVNTTRAQVESVLKLKKMNDDLLREKKKLDTIFEFSTNEIVLTDIDFNILSQNFKILNAEITEKNNLQKTLEIYCSKEQNNEIEAFKNSETKSLSLNVRLKEKFTKINLSKIIINGNLTGFLSVINDITEEVELQRQRERFIETLTHDLKTPVRAEKRAIELMIEGTFGSLNSEQEEMLNEILNSSKYMLRMTDNILTKYKIDNGQNTLNKTDNILKLTINNCVANIKYLLSAKNQTLKVSTDIKDEIFSYDEVEINRVLFNLLANAAEYAPADTTIELSVIQKENELEIFVKDEGIGIPEDKLESVFDEYETSAKRFKKVGSGLGLFITKKIIEAHGGRIRAESKQEEGAKFIFTLPVTQTSNVETAI